LPLTVLAVMGGIVLAANPGHYGSAAVVVGSLMALLGIALTIRLFRAAEVRETDESTRREADPARIQDTEGEIEI
jgi:uncharacterized membrane protein HdeD (DUF308 family)